MNGQRLSRKISKMIGAPTKRSCLAALILLAPLTWCTMALWLDIPAAYDLPSEQLIAGFLAVLLGCGSLTVLLFLQPLRRSLFLVLALILVVIIWWFTIPASNDRQWLPDVARPATAELNGDRLTIHNLRNFDYNSETDFQENWQTRTFDLNKLRGVDIFFCFWGPTAIAHTIASWEFTDGQHLAISIETRKEKGESYSAIKGFFRQFELYYVIADEQDVIRLRTNYRGEQLFLYQTTFSPEESRLLLEDYLQEVNHLARQPVWYNAFTMSCTTTIRMHLKDVNLAKKFDWRVLLNGYADEMIYEHGLLNSSIPFAELRRRSDITQVAKRADSDPDFSTRLRQEIPVIRP